MTNLTYTIVDGDGDLGMAVADLWRVAGGRIVEYRDVVQEVPENSVNSNTTFSCGDGRDHARQAPRRDLGCGRRRAL